MLVLVPTVRTTYSTFDLIKAFVVGWFQLYKIKPLKSQIAVIYAQNTLETGGSIAMYCNNIGNIKAVDNVNEIIKYCMLANTWEIIAGRKIIYQPPHPATWFRAFDTLAEGVEYQFNFLRNQRYKTAWAAVEKGDPALFSHLLRQQGYYTAPEADYTKAMQYHFNVFMNGPTFDKVMQELESLFNQVHFPADYTPLEFNVINDTVNRVEAPQLAPQGLWQRFLAFIGNK